MIDFHADWCIPCKEMERFTFAHEDVLERSKSYTMIKVDLTKIKAYGDRLGDGAVQLSFTLPVAASPEAKEAAKLYVKKMGLKKIRVAHMESMGEQFTFFVVYATAPHSINVKKIKVPKIEAPYMDYKTLTKFMEEKF